MRDQTHAYLARAAECERRAACARDGKIRNTFLELADHWRHIAHELETLTRLQQELRAPAWWATAKQGDTRRLAG